MTDTTRGRGNCSHSSFTFHIHVHINLTLESTLDLRAYVDDERVIWLSVFSPCTSQFYLFCPNSAPILILLSAPLMGIWNHIKSLQLGIELSRHKISEGTSMPLNTAPIINKLSERQFGRAVIGADFA